MQGKRRALCRQADATRLLKAYQASGYETVKLTVRPDGTIEALGSNAAGVSLSQDTGSWDEVLR